MSIQKCNSIQSISFKISKLARTSGVAGTVITLKIFQMDWSC